ncbi:hypothetical protein AB6F95_004640 [Salmonella enterica]
MFTVVLANKDEVINPEKRANKSVGLTFSTIEAAQENAKKRNAQIPPHLQDKKEYRAVELSIRAQRDLLNRGVPMTVGDRNRRKF